MFRQKSTLPVRQFKAALDNDAARRKREESSVSLRKEKREENLAKRRINTEGKIAGADTTSLVSVYTAANATPEELRSKLKDLPQLVSDLNGNDPTRQLTAVTLMRKMLSIENNPPIQNIIDAGCVRRLVSLLSVENNTQIQFEAAWTLTNIASGTASQTRVVIEAGAVQQFVQLMRSPNEDIKDQAVWALGNIAGDSPQCRDFVLKCGAMPAVLDCIHNNAKQTLLRNATWTISNLCRGKPQPDFRALQPCLPKLAQLIMHSNDEEILADACWALSYLSDDKDNDNAKIQAVIESGIVPKMVSFLGQRSDKIRTPALRTVGNIVTGDDSQTQAVVNCGALRALLPMLMDPKKAIRKEACWAISNITAGSAEQIRICVDAGVFPPLINLLKSAEYEVKKEAAWAISNATSGGTPKHIRYLVEMQVIPALCDQLTCNDPKIVMVCLEGIENVLKSGGVDGQKGGNKYTDAVEECDGLDKLEELQKHDNEEIYAKALKIIQTFFEVADDEEPSKAATESSSSTSSNGGFNFSSAPTQNNGFSFGGATPSAPFEFGKPASSALTVPSAPFQFQFNFS